MKRRSLVITLFAVSLPLLLSTPASAQVDANTLLYLNFENSLVGAAGEVPTSVTGTTYTPGIQGSGLKISEGDRLRYAAASNIQASAGTVELFLKPGWNGNDSVNHNILTWGGEGGVVINKDGANNLRIYFNRFQVPVGEQNIGIDVSDWQADAWRGIAFAWDATGARIYIDGNLAISQTFTLPLNTPAEALFDLGTDNGTSAVDATIDELRISDIPRTATEIKSYYDRFTQSAAAPEPASLGFLILSGISTLGGLRTLNRRPARRE